MVYTMPFLCYLLKYLLFLLFSMDVLSTCIANLWTFFLNGFPFVYFSVILLLSICKYPFIFAKLAFCHVYVSLFLNGFSYMRIFWNVTLLCHWLLICQSFLLWLPKHIFSLSYLFCIVTSHITTFQNYNIDAFFHLI